MKSLRLVATPPAKRSTSSRGSRANPAGFVQSAVPSSATATAAPAIPAARGTDEGRLGRQRRMRGREIDSEIAAVERRFVICDL